MAQRLVDRQPPPLAAVDLVARLVPPPQFAAVRLDSYRPDPAHPSQEAALRRAAQFVDELSSVTESARRGIFRRAASASPPRGIYLDGGSGVGKTHLLASVWHAAPAPKSYATFVELTHLVGALGFAASVDALRDRRLLCIDEFELDDPGDTVLISTLLTRLSESGVGLAVTSNTLPDALGEGRFAAADFLREIQALAARFDVVTVDGEDYRHRGLPVAPRAASDVDLEAIAAEPSAAIDDFGELMEWLALVHPSRYGDLLDGVGALGWRAARPVSDQAVALRLVVLVDRAYDRGLPLVVTGVPLGDLFAPEILTGGYRKKYLRALSRAIALARSAEVDRS